MLREIHSCSSCLALRNIEGSFVCLLGYTIEQEQRVVNKLLLNTSPKPVDRCPKPLNQKSLDKELKKKK